MPDAQGMNLHCWAHIYRQKSRLTITIRLQCYFVETGHHNLVTRSELAGRFDYAAIPYSFRRIYWPFEYPDAWLAEGRDWNEAYFIHAFLAYNDRFRILLFQHFLHSEHPCLIPVDLGPGSSLWMVKGDDAGPALEARPRNT
jgi:hypothetical protein